MEGALYLSYLRTVADWELEDDGVVDLEEFLHPGRFVVEGNFPLEAADAHGGLLNPGYGFGED